MNEQIIIRRFDQRFNQEALRKTGAFIKKLNDP